MDKKMTVNEKEYTAYSAKAKADTLIWQAMGHKNTSSNRSITNPALIISSAIRSRQRSMITTVFGKSGSESPP